MCVIGYLAFIFFAESARLKRRPTSRRLRAKHTLALWMGGLIALSSLASLFVSGGLADKLKPSLLVAALSVLALSVVMKFTPAAGKNTFRKRWDRMLYGDMQPTDSGSSVQAARTNAQNSAQQSSTLEQTVEPVNVVEPVQTIAAPVQTTPQQFAHTEGTATIVEQQPLSDSAATNFGNSDFDTTETAAVENRVKDDLVDQTGHANFVEMDIENEFPVTGFVQHDQPAAANSGVFDAISPTTIANDNDEIIVDDFFDEVDGQNRLDDSFPVHSREADPVAVENKPVPEVLEPVNVHEDVVYTSEPTTAHTAGLSSSHPGETLDGNNESLEAPQVEEVYLHGDSSHAESYAETEQYEELDKYETAPVAEEWTEAGIPELAADASEIDQLAHAMNSVSGDAVRIQESVSKINKLHEQEQYYRTQLNGARLAYEKAQEAQFEGHAHDLEDKIKAGAEKLQSEQSNRKKLEVNLDDKRRALLQAEMRVTELESELKARQQVFHDQVASLEKTKEMARNAAQLARRAAVMQQRARTTALQERAKRERLEVSAKKAVNIARNAISKLAEEERKNSSSRGLH